jgi:hypothetical protein
MYALQLTSKILFLLFQFFPRIPILLKEIPDELFYIQVGALQYHCYLQSILYSLK